MIAKLYLHDGTEHEEVIENFNLVEFIESVNTDQHKMIQFGGIGVMKTQIKKVDTNQPEVAPEPEVVV